MENIIKTKELPREILNKLPYSLRIQETINVDILPEPYKTLILEYTIDNKKSDDLIYDIALTKGKFDITHINDVKTAIINYISNFFKIKRGTYPFDPEYGTTIYEYLQSRNLHAFEIVINNELKQLLNELSDMFKSNLNLAKLTVNTIDTNEKSIYVINISVEINNELVNLSINATV